MSSNKPLSNTYLIVFGALFVVPFSSGAETTLDPGRYETQTEVVEGDADFAAAANGQAATQQCVTSVDVANMEQTLRDTAKKEMAEQDCDMTVNKDGNTYTLNSQCQVSGQPYRSEMVMIVDDSTHYTTTVSMPDAPTPLKMQMTSHRVGACSE